MSVLVKRKSDTDPQDPNLVQQDPRDLAGAKALLGLKFPFSIPEQSTTALRNRAKQVRSELPPAAASDPFALMIDNKSTKAHLSTALHKVTTVLLKNDALDLDDQERSLLTEWSQSLVQNLQHLVAMKDFDICAALVYLSHYEKALPSSLVLTTYEKLFSNLRSLPSDPHTIARIKVLLDSMLHCLKIICIRRGNLEFSDIKNLIFNDFTFQHVGYAKSFIVMGALSDSNRKHEVAKTYALDQSTRNYLCNLFLLINPKDRAEKFSIIHSLFLLVKNQYIYPSEFVETLLTHLRTHYLQEQYSPELQQSIDYLLSLSFTVRRVFHDLNNRPPRKVKRRWGETLLT